MRRRVLVLLAVVVPVLALAAWSAQRALNSSMQLPAAGYLLDIPAGSSLQSVAAGLEQAGVLANPWLLSAYGRLTGTAANIKAGEYEIAPGTTPLGLLRQLVAGVVRLHSLTIIEGWTARDVLAAVRRHSAIKKTELTRNAESLASGMELPTPSPEGWFYPDTYRFPRGTTDLALLTMASERMKTLLERAWADREPGLPLGSAYEALTLASIVEKETSLERERTQVAGVFIRRLRAGMRLQTDPTVIYGLGRDYDGNITRQDLARDTPYNTYTRPGLPPSPIAIPRESSILAVLHPDKSDTLYFVASGDPDRSHVFSATLSEHNAAVRKFLAASRQGKK